MRFGAKLGWLLLALAAGRATFAEGIALLVPAYFEPGTGRWRTLSAAAGRVPVVAIANVFNGPGTETTGRPEYIDALRSLRDAGGQVAGYVYTEYAKRSLELVKKDMRHWHDLYPLDGFFVDEMSNDPSGSNLEYYAELLSYAHELRPEYRVIGNPGTNTDELYLKRPTADVLVIFEHHSGYPAFTPAAWTKRYPEHQFAHLAYAANSAEQMTNFVSLAVARHAGFIYVTDDQGDNPWDTLPSYWEEEISLVASLNRAAAERVRAQLSLVAEESPALSLSAKGAVGRHILEAAAPLGRWQPLTTNLTNTGTSVWRVLNLAPNRFFRVRQD